MLTWERLMFAGSGSAWIARPTSAAPHQWIGRVTKGRRLPWAANPTAIATPKRASTIKIVPTGCSTTVGDRIVPSASGQVQ